MMAPAGTRFNYNGGSTTVPTLLLTEHVGMFIPGYVHQRLFEPLGVTDRKQAGDYHDRPLTFIDVRLRLRDLARTGRLMLQHDRWNGRQLVPAEWIAESTCPRIDTGVGL